MSDDITEAADEIERLQSALDAALRDAERARAEVAAVAGDEYGALLRKLWRRCDNQRRQLRNLQRAHDTLWKVLNLRMADSAISSERGG